MGTMRARFQSGQIVGIEAALPAIEGLATDAKVTAGMGHVALAVIEVHPGQPNPGFPAELHSDSSQSAPTGRVPFANLHIDTLIRVSLIILNENTIDARLSP